MSAQKPIQLILARQLASSLAMPVIILDTQGTVIYYNEPAEELLNQRFDETGAMPAERWGADFGVQNDDRVTLHQQDWPVAVALMQRKPVSQLIWLMCPDRQWRHLHWTSVPLIAQTGDFLGVLSMFWEVAEPGL